MAEFLFGFAFPVAMLLLGYAAGYRIGYRRGAAAHAARLAEAERLLREVVDLPLWDEPVGGGEVGNRIEAWLTGGA